MQGKHKKKIDGVVESPLRSTSSSRRSGFRTPPIAIPVPEPSAAAFVAGPGASPLALLFAAEVNGEDVPGKNAAERMRTLSGEGSKEKPATPGFG